MMHGIACVRKAGDSIGLIDDEDNKNAKARAGQVAHLMWVLALAVKWFAAKEQQAGDNGRPAGLKCR